MRVTKTKVLTDKYMSNAQLIMSLTLYFGFSDVLMIASNRDHHKWKSDQGCSRSLGMDSEGIVQEIEGRFRYHSADGEV